MIFNTIKHVFIYNIFFTLLTTLTATSMNLPSLPDSFTQLNQGQQAELQCLICLESINVSRLIHPALKGDCLKHPVCTDCFEQWIKVNGHDVCPTCKVEVAIERTFFTALWRFIKGEVQSYLDYCEREMRGEVERISFEY